MSLQAGAVGLNLQEASTVVLFDRWWTPAVENQAIGRAHRIGSKEPVTAYKFLVRDTVEQKLDVILKSPPFYAIIIAVILLYYEIKLPVFIENTTFLLMYATIFLILMSLGIALTRLKVFSFNKALFSSIGRVILGPVVGYLLIIYFNLEGFAAGALLIQCSMPSAVLTYLVGSMYSPKKIVDSIASMIVVSTLMSFITIPIVVFISLKYFQ